MKKNKIMKEKKKNCDKQTVKRRKEVDEKDKKEGKEEGKEES